MLSLNLLVVMSNCWPFIALYFILHLKVHLYLHVNMYTCAPMHAVLALCSVP